jgi:hypothetical protein
MADSNALVDHVAMHDIPAVSVGEGVRDFGQYPQGVRSWELPLPSDSFT